MDNVSFMANDIFQFKRAGYLYEEDSLIMLEVDLGFAEERDDAAKWLSNRYFPSKIGGKPAWLELDVLPEKEALQCRKCAQPLSFLCQIYAPGDDDHSFHRTIYVFICREPECQVPNDAVNLTVFRSQLAVKNDYYSEQPPEEEGEPQPEIVGKKKLCHLCGCSGPFTCGRCKKANYCSSKHQRAMWPFHKNYCLKLEEKHDTMPAIESEKWVFAEFEIAIEPNDNQKSSSDKEIAKEEIDKEEEERLKEFDNLAKMGKTGTFTDIPDEELEKYATNSNEVNDKFFRRFKNEISNDPLQVIRYKRFGEPLWITDVQQTIEAQLKDIPKCEICGSARVFEFQIMPQLLILLKDDNLDWGVLAVYTCSKNCEIPKGVGYTREYIIKQDLISEST